MILYESHQSRNLSDGNLSVNYVVTGSTDPIDVRNAVLIETQDVLFDRVRREPGLEFVGGDLWKVEIPYTPGDPSEAVQPEGQPGSEGAGGGPGGGGGEGGPGQGGSGQPSPEPGEDDPIDDSVSCSFGGGTAHVLLSKETRGRYKAGGGAAPDNKRAIGITDTGIDGVDIPVSTPVITIKRRRRVITWRYFRTLHRMVGKTNDRTFRGYVQGELRYGPPQIEGSSKKGFEVTHQFEFAEDQPPGDARNVITDDITLTAGKRGWEYVWCAYTQTEIDETKIYPVPTAAYVERPHDEANFADLQI